MSEARNTAGPAMSAGLPARFRGVWRMTMATMSGVRRCGPREALPLVSLLRSACRQRRPDRSLAAVRARCMQEAAKLSARQPHLIREKNMAFTIKINGKQHSVDVDGDTPLLWVLRDVLGMSGTKFGCGMALCGACTVHIDGTATRSCITTVDSLQGSEVTTIEAIGATPAGARIQKAWLDKEVVQCGYCQSGQIMSAAALLAQTPKPTDADIDEAMSGNICRCGTYMRIREAIKLAAQSHVKGG